MYRYRHRTNIGLILGPMSLDFLALLSPRRPQKGRRWRIQHPDSWVVTCWLSSIPSWSLLRPCPSSLQSISSWPRLLPSCFSERSWGKVLPPSSPSRSIEASKQIRKSKRGARVPRAESHGRRRQLAPHAGRRPCRRRCLRRRRP